jgi:hypothetical protein
VVANTLGARRQIRPNAVQFEFMIEVTPSPEQIEKAQQLAVAMGEINNSITKGGGNVYGFLGELIVADYLKVERADQYDFDLVRKGKRLDVKTKHCTSKPRPEYECSIAARGVHQQCDYYIFVRVLKDLSRAWILGWISKEDYFKLCTPYHNGDKDPNSNMGWTFKADCYNLPIAKLNQFNDR